MSVNWLFAAALAASLGDQSNLVVAELGDFGETYQFETKQAQFRVLNNSDRSIAISVSPARATDKVLHAPNILEPHSAATVDVAISSRNETGVHLHSFPVRIAGESKVAYGQVKGFVESVLDETSPLIDFGVVDRRINESARKAIRLTSDEDPDFSIASVLAAPEFVDVAIGEDKRSLTATMKADQDWGIKDAMIKLALNGRKQKQAWVEVRADVHGDVVPFSNPFGFGVARQGQDNQYLIRLDHRDGKDFALDGLRLEGFKGELLQQACIPEKLGCRLVKLHVADDQPTGKLNGKILIGFPELHGALQINVWGMLFKSDAKIVDLNDEANKRANEKTPLPPLASILKAATAEKPAPIVAPAPPGTGPLLKWSVQDEQQLYGYIIYRADSEGGVMRRINDAIIRTLSDMEGVSVEYRWRDTTAQPGRTYWYQIGTVNLRGARNNLTGAVKKTYLSDVTPSH